MIFSRRTLMGNKDSVLTIHLDAPALGVTVDAGWARPAALAETLDV